MFKRGKLFKTTDLSSDPYGVFMKEFIAASDLQTQNTILEKYIDQFYTTKRKTK